MFTRDREAATTPGVTGLVCAALIACATMSSAQQFRVPTPLAQIVGSADAVVIGRISAVEPETFTLYVEEVIVSRVAAELQSLTIDRASRAPTDPRWAPYREEQTILVFLKSLDGGGRWAFAGPPNDSEWPVDGERVYMYDRFVEGLPLQKIHLDGQEFHAQSLPRATVVAALEDYSSVFRWEKLPAQGRWRPKKLGASGLAEDFPARSALHRLLVEETKAEMDEGTP